MEFIQVGSYRRLKKASAMTISTKMAAPKAIKRIYARANPIAHKKKQKKTDTVEFFQSV